MKKYNKIFWTVCASIAGVGLLFVMIGFLTGARISDFKEQFAYGLTISDLGFEGNYKDGESKQFEGVTEIDIDVDANKVEILPHDKSYVEVIVQNYNDQQRVLAELDGTELQIKSRVHQWNDVVGPNSTIKIYLPKDVVFKEIDIDLSTSELLAENIRAKKITLSIGAGRAELNSLDVDEFSLDNGVAETEITNLKVRDGQVECGVGKVKMDIIGKQEDYNYEYSVGIGSISIGDDKYSGLAGEQKVDNNANQELSFECGIGDIKVTFSKIEGRN